MKKSFYVLLGFITMVSFTSCFVKSNTLNSKTLYSIVRVNENTEDIEAVLEYPVFVNNKDLNEEVERLVFAYYDFFKEKILPKVDIPCFYSINCDKISINDSYATMIFNIYSYTGGANGEHKLDSITYSLPEKKLLSITDITEASGKSLESIAEYCKASLKENSSDKSAMAFSAIDEGTMTMGDKAFTYDGKLFTVYFEPAQVAPSSEGVKKVEFIIAE